MTSKLALVAILTYGCGGAELEIEESSDPLLSKTTYSYGGSLLNSYTLSGSSSTLSIYESVDPYAGIAPNGPSFSDGASVTTSGVLTGWDLVGKTVTGSIDGVGSTSLTVRSAALGTGRNSTVFYYQVEKQIFGNWIPLCGWDGSGAPIKALAVPGTWDTSSGTMTGGDWRYSQTKFTFACLGSSIAKCVEMGYRSTVRDRDAIPQHLLSCVRAMRADYCGDGTSWTTSGRNIELWDDRSINTRTMSSWPREAGWTNSGASCLDSARLQYPNASPNPSCSTTLSTVSCGSHNARWTIMNSFEPPQ